MKINREPLWANEKAIAKKKLDFWPKEILNECDFHKSGKIPGIPGNDKDFCQFLAKMWKYSSKDIF